MSNKSSSTSFLCTPRLVGGLACALTLLSLQSCSAAAPRTATTPSYVDITWMSVTNMYFEVDGRKILADSYITRIPEDAFHGGGGGLANTSRPFKPDVETIRKVRDAIGGRSAVDLLLTGHNHFDHAFDTATWAKLTDATIMGSPTTCYQVEAEAISRDRCTPLFGGERISLTNAVTMYVVRWNHSGDPAKNPEQHDAVELDAPPKPDLATGGLRAGVAEDFPNGGGNRAYLFVVDGADGRFSWFFHDSASPVDLHVPIVVDGKDYGAPLDNLKQAMLQAKIDSVDLWIGTGSKPVAELIVPVLRPKVHIPVHWDNFWSPFLAGVTQPYSDAALEQYLSAQSVTLIKPRQYMDKWRLDARGTQSIPNENIQRSLGFSRNSGARK